MEARRRAAALPGLPISINDLRALLRLPRGRCDDSAVRPRRGHPSQPLAQEGQQAPRSQEVLAMEHHRRAWRGRARLARAGAHGTSTLSAAGSVAHAPASTPGRRRQRRSHGRAATPQPRRPQRRDQPEQCQDAPNTGIGGLREVLRARRPSRPPGCRGTERARALVQRHVGQVPPVARHHALRDLRRKPDSSVVHPHSRLLQSSGRRCQGGRPRRERSSRRAVVRHADRQGAPGVRARFRADLRRDLRRRGPGLRTRLVEPASRTRPSRRRGDAARVGPHAEHLRQDILDRRAGHARRRLRRPVDRPRRFVPDPCRHDQRGAAVRHRVRRRRCRWAICTRRCGRDPRSRLAHDPPLAEPPGRPASRPPDRGHDRRPPRSRQRPVPQRDRLPLRDTPPRTRRSATTRGSRPRRAPHLRHRQGRAAPADGSVLA